jgi:cell division protease FtsH
MSDAVGPVAVVPRDGSGPLLPGAAEVAPETQRLVDDEGRRIVEDTHRDVLDLLREHRRNLDALVSALLEHEMLGEADAYAAAGVSRAHPAADPATAAA